MKTGSKATVKRSSIITISLSSVLAVTTAMPAHAGLISGFSNAVNEAFTFREEQKDRVSPRKPLPPKIVTEPYYNERDAIQWASYYTREDLEAVQHMDDATYVMRPGVRQRSADNYHSKSWNGRSNDPTVSHPRDDRFGGPNQAPIGYEALERRDMLNRRAMLKDNVFIGEPGTSPFVDYHTGMNLGMKTQIGAPVQSWKDGKQDGQITPRPGDFDYSQNVHGDRGYEVSRSSGYVNPDAERPNLDTFDYEMKRIDQENYDAPDRLPALEKPTVYTVEPDDTLSGISNKDQIYGDWKLWPLIHDANRGQISDPDLIHPDQRLGIPRNYSNEDEYNARERATQKQAPYSFYDGQ